MASFLYHLRAAHSIVVAHQRGDHTIGAIAHRTSRNIIEVSEWCRLLNLPLASPRLVREAEFLSIN